MHTPKTPEELNSAEQAVLELAAQNQGALEIANRSDTRGLAVRGGHDKLYDPDNPNYAKECCDAVSQLVDWQLLRTSSKPKHYELTNFGWQLSRKLTVQANEQMQATSESSLEQAETNANAQEESALAGISQVKQAVASPMEHSPAVDDTNEEAPIESTINLSGGDNPLAAFRLPTAPPEDPTPSQEMPESLSPLSQSSWNPAAEDSTDALINSLGLDEGFVPEEPCTIEETGLDSTLIEDLILKVLLNAGSLTGKQISDRICLRLAILEDLYAHLRKKQLIAPTGSAMLGDHVYQLTDQGRERARNAMKECAYAGPAPVPLDDYCDSVQAQTIRTEKPKKAQLEKAFSDINVEPEMLAQLGPAISAGKGMFIYGPPGNGKTTVAQRITRCFGQNILVPHAIVEDGQIIKFYDASCHEQVESTVSKLIKSSDEDRRWIRIRRPTVVVGGELTMESLELSHDPVSHVSGASLQLKSNCGSLLIDDFGRQRINPTELLNRWIVPLENRIDYLSLANGKKVEVPFEQLIIFSTNLEPHDLADDAFLRRIPFKIEVGAPSREEFVKLFNVFAQKTNVECTLEALDYLISHHYDNCDRPMRRCHARDLLDQVAHFCEYNEMPKVATHEILDHAVRNYFTALSGKE